MNIAFRLLIASTLQVQGQAADTLALMRVLGHELRSQHRHAVGIQLDTGCTWPASVCSEVGPGWVTQNTEMLDTLVQTIGPIAQKSFAPTKSCEYYNAGPLAVYVRAPVFSGSRATIVVTTTCLSSEAGRRRFAHAEELEFRWTSEGWAFVGRRTVWIT